MAITPETVFNGFKNKNDIKTALRSVQLGPNTVAKRDVDRQVLKDLSHCEYFSLQFDESLDALLDELDAAYGDLLKVLQRFVDLLPEIKTFLETRNGEHEELSGDQWLLDLGFLTDLTAKMNALNNELQGKDRHLSHTISAVNAFKAKLGLWNTHLKNGRLRHFPNLEKMSQQAIGDKDAFYPEQ
ncbi:GTD2B protein%2C partial [Scomber scombrus]|uniref:GTD2B protein, partial n=1 Tax=Scomber scombrus TaxID=13677 RepID=A0AAV1PAP4_SCOSC